eukprot:GEMP01007957.1.p1 GENE.GEMP01007957.1~~GEMP01007957.1.p1  ORF type:complete len:852 (+),score=232.62 GEMP01007957.1:34-2556(+)
MDKQPYSPAERNVRAFNSTNDTHDAISTAAKAALASELRLPTPRESVFNDLDGDSALPTKRRATMPADLHTLTRTPLASPKGRATVAYASGTRPSLDLSLRLALPYRGRVAMEELESRIEGLEESAEAASEAAVGAQRDSEEKIRNFENQQITLRNSLEEETRQRRRIHADAVELQSLVSRYKIDADTCRADSAKLRAEASEFRESHIDVIEQCVELKCTLAFKESEQSVDAETFLKSRRKEAQENHALTTKIAELETEYSREHLRATRGETEYQGLQSELHRALSRISTMTQVEADLVDTTTALRRQTDAMDSLQAKHRDTEQRRQDADARCEEYRMTLAELEHLQEVEKRLCSEELASIDKRANDTQERLSGVISDINEALAEQKLQNIDLSENNLYLQAQVPFFEHVKEEFLEAQKQKLDDRQEAHSKEQRLLVESEHKDVQWRTEVTNLTSKLALLESEAEVRANRELELRHETARLAATVEELRPTEQRCEVMRLKISEQEEAFAAEKVAMAREKGEIHSLLCTSQKQVLSLMAEVDESHEKLEAEQSRFPPLADSIRRLSSDMDKQYEVTKVLRGCLEEKNDEITKMHNTETELLANLLAITEELQKYGQRFNELTKKEMQSRKEIKWLSGRDAELHAVSELLGLEKSITDSLQEKCRQYDAEIKTLKENASLAQQHTSKMFAAQYGKVKKENIELANAEKTQEEAKTMASREAWELRRALHDEVAACDVMRTNMQAEQSQNDSALRELRVELADYRNNFEKSDAERVDLELKIKGVQERHVATEKALKDDCASLTLQLRGLSRKSERRDKELAALLQSNPRRTPRWSTHISHR